MKGERGDERVGEGDDERVDGKKNEKRDSGERVGRMKEHKGG